MADVDNSVGVIYQRRSTRTTSESDKVSPKVKDAMDRIFPKSPSKFLQNPFPDSQEMLLSGNRIPSSNAPTSVTVLDVNNQPLACTISNAHITTDTTTTATAIFTGLTTSASGTKSPIMSSLSAYCNNMASLPASAVIKNVSEQNGISSGQSKTISSNTKKSRADLHMCPKVVNETNPSNNLEKVGNESVISSQSETSHAKEKKRMKKRKKQRLNEITDSDSSVNLVTSPNNGYSCSSHSEANLVVNGEIISAEDALTSYPNSIKIKQKLPKVKKIYLNVGKDTKYIQKKFLPCYVVMKKANDNYCGEILDLSLPERVKHLSELCLKNYIDCAKFKSIQYKNIFEECLIQNSEDEFISPRGRSLRKRNQNVSYVEPSEDDLLEDITSFSRAKKAQNKLAIEIQQKDNSHKKDDESKEKGAVVEEVKDSDNGEHKDKSEKLTKKKNKTKYSPYKATQNNKSSEIDQVNSGTTSSILKDDRGRSLVYVYPKGSVQKKKKGITDAINNKDVKSGASPKKRMGPASKTNQPLNLSVTASLTTLSLPRSLLSGNLTVRGITTMASSPNIHNVVQSTATSSPQFYMVKIDGKDFLVPVMTGASAPRPGITGPPNASLLTRAPTSNVTNSPFPINRLSSVMIPGMPMTTGVRMFTPALPTTNILSNVPLLGASQLATSCIPVSGLSQIGLGTNGPPQLIPPSIMSTITQPSKSANITSLVRAPLSTSMNLIPSISQSTLITKNTTPGIPTVVAPLAAPASTTVLRSTRPRAVTTVVSQSVTSNFSNSNSRCFRIIVPGCTATGVPARIATLGSQANSSPLTHMALSSSLLPQRKRTVDEMSPEKRAAKRRRLEKKYPLPPGVIIKTEPDEVPTPTTSTFQSGSVRSLLGPNIQLITSTARSGPSAVQNIRLVSPISGSRQMRLGTNFIIRAPNNSISLSSGSLSASSLIVSPSTQSVNVPVSASNVVNMTAGSTTTPALTATSCTTTTTVTESTTTTISQLSTLTSSSINNASDRITTLSYSTSPSHNLITPSSKDKTTASLDTLMGSINDLKKLISTQETVGLKGPRLDKLKDILAQKEKALTELEKEQANVDLSGVSAFDPVVID